MRPYSHLRTESGRVVRSILTSGICESGSGRRFSGGSSPPWWAAQLGSERSHWVKVHPATCQPPRCHTKITADIYIGNVKPSVFPAEPSWALAGFLQTCAQLELCNLIWCLLKYIMASSHLLNYRVHMNKMKVHIRLKHERLSVSLPQWFDGFFTSQRNIYWAVQRLSIFCLDNYMFYFLY